MCSKGSECLSDWQGGIRPTCAFLAIHQMVSVFCVVRITQADSAQSCLLMPDALRLIGLLGGEQAQTTRPRFSTLQSIL